MAHLKEMSPLNYQIRVIWTVTLNGVEESIPSTRKTWNRTPLLTRSSNPSKIGWPNVLFSQDMSWFHVLSWLFFENVLVFIIFHWAIKLTGTRALFIYIIKHVELPFEKCLCQIHKSEFVSLVIDSILKYNNFLSIQRRHTLNVLIL